MEPLKIELNRWQVGQYECSAPDYIEPEPVKDPVPAKVPGCVQYDLLRAGRLANPYAGTQAAFEAAWVAKRDWLYETVFHIPAALDRYSTAVLKLWGVDTFCEVWLNGVHLGNMDSAYCSYELPVEKGLLLPRKNQLKIRVKAHGRMIEDKLEDARRLKRGDETEGLLGKSLIRRYQRSFFTASSLLNVGTGVLGIGIHRPVELFLYPGAYVVDAVYGTEYRKAMEGDLEAVAKAADRN